MERNDEEKFNNGLAVLEMSRTKGWKLIENKISTELRIEYSEIREFDISGMTVDQIAAEYLQHRANINAYEKILNMVGTSINEKEEAAKSLSR